MLGRPHRFLPLCAVAGVAGFGAAGAIGTGSGTARVAGGPADWKCGDGPAVTLFDNTNTALVGNGGTPPQFSTHGVVYCVTYIQTYHWNDGGGVRPGKIGLERVAAPPGFPATLGPFKSFSTSGQNNAPDVNWLVHLDRSDHAIIVGTYRCTDSSRATWSANKKSGGRGFCIVAGTAAVPVSENTTSTTTTVPTTTTAVTTTGRGYGPCLCARLAVSVDKTLLANTKLRPDQ